MTTKAFLEKRGDRVLDGGKILKMRLMEAEKGRGRMRREKEAARGYVTFIFHFSNGDAYIFSFYPLDVCGTFWLRLK